MNKFEPSNDFVAKVMKDVRAYESTRETLPPFSMRLFASRPARWVISVVGLLLGSWNLVRLYLSLLAPVICR